MVYLSARTSLRSRHQSWLLPSRTRNEMCAHPTQTSRRVASDARSRCRVRTCAQITTNVTPKQWLCNTARKPRFPGFGPWVASMVAGKIGSRSSASVQWWGKVSSWHADRPPADVDILTVTTAGPGVLKATGTVVGITPCNYCFHRSFS